VREELIAQIIETQRRMNRVIRERTLGSWVKLNLTVPQLKSLFYISRHGRVNLSGLASGIQVTPANVTGIVDRLVEQELLTRLPDADDRRILWLRLTGKAEALLANLREVRASEMHKILDRLSTRNLSKLARAFDMLEQAVEVNEKEEPPSNG
jgi:DNA-binding MarR family transcriptional regulator